MVVSLDEVKGSKFIKSYKEFEKLFNETQLSFDLTTREHFSGYLEFGKFLIENGRHVENMMQGSWHKYNYRYGASSIDGTKAEMFAIWMWNQFSAGTRLVLGSAEKESEVSGQDLIFASDRWDSAYYGQCKLSTICKEWATLPSSIKNYSLDKVHRIILSDVQSRRIIVVDYPFLLRRIEQERTVWKNGVRLISHTELKKHARTSILELVNGKVRVV